MQSENIKGLYQKAFQGIDDGRTYEQMSDITGIPTQLIQIEHIRTCRESEDYLKELRSHTLRFIKKHGYHVLTIENINKLEKTIPYRFRFTVKHLIHNIKKQLLKRQSDAVS